MGGEVFNKQKGLYLMEGGFLEMSAEINWKGMIVLFVDAYWTYKKMGPSNQHGVLQSFLDKLFWFLENKHVVTNDLILNGVHHQMMLRKECILLEDRRKTDASAWLLCSHSTHCTSGLRWGDMKEGTLHVAMEFGFHWYRSTFLLRTFLQDHPDGLILLNIVSDTTPSWRRLTHRPSPSYLPHQNFPLRLSENSWTSTGVPLEHQASLIPKAALKLAVNHGVHRRRPLTATDRLRHGGNPPGLDPTRISVAIPSGFPTDTAARWRGCWWQGMSPPRNGLIWNSRNYPWRRSRGRRKWL